MYMYYLGDMLASSAHW